MEPVGLWEWFGLIFLLAIPIVNIVVMIVFACGVGKPSLVNFGRASLIWFAIFFVLGVILSILLPSLLGVN